MDVPSLRSIRVAGALYVLLGVLGVIGLMYIPRQFVVPGDGAATLANMRAQDGLVRLGIALELAGNGLFIAVAFALYRVFKRVSVELGATMVLLAALSVPLAFAASAAQLAALSLVSGTTAFPSAPAANLDALAYTVVRLHGQLLLTAEVFWGLWLVPLALLEWRSGFVPRILGAAVLIGALGYLFDVAVVVLAQPDAAPTLRTLASVAEVGELGTIAWLVVRSVRPMVGVAAVARTGLA